MTDNKVLDEESVRKEQLKDWVKNAFKQGQKSKLYKNGRVYFCKVCNKDNIFYPLKTRPCWSCKNCGTQIFPNVGTIFEKSTTPPEKWQLAIEMVKEDKFVLAKEIAEACGVTYKTGWRMRRLIREALYPDFISKGRGNFQPKK